MHKCILMPKAMKIQDAKAVANQEWRKREKILTRQLTKVRNKREVINEARKEGTTVHIASLMDICHIKNSELEPKISKIQKRPSCTSR